jgi:hypothetical protein
MFASYPTAALAPGDTVMLARPFAPGEAAELLDRPFVRADAPRLPSLAEVETILALLATQPRTVGALLAEISPERRPFLERGIVWLAKFGFVRLRDGTSRT